MSAGEFQLIERHFTALGAARGDVVLGVGDDAALLAAPPGCRFAVASASASGDTTPIASELARECFTRAEIALQAVGATPAWLTLALTLEHIREPWVEQFAAALHDLCCAANVCVVGGDTTAGPDAVTIFLTGIAPA